MHFILFQNYIKPSKPCNKPNIWEQQLQEKDKSKSSK